MRACRSCAGEVEFFLDLGDQALSDFRKDSTYRSPSFPLNVGRCRSCGLVQLEVTTPRELMYHDRYGFKSGVNENIREDLRSVVVEGLQKHGNARSWLDIASNDGTLLSFLPKTGLYRVGVDPVSKWSEEASSVSDELVTDFFSSDHFAGQKFDVISSISMFYDLDDPNFFVEDVKKVLAEDGLWIVQQNYLLAMVEWGAVDNISHEHITYFSLDSFMQLMNRHGLEVHDVSVSSINGGSFRAFVSNKGVHPVHPRVQDQLEREKSLQSLRPFELFAARARRNLTELSQLINSLCEQGMSVYVLGASTRGSTIWQAANLDVRQIKKAVERNPEKVGLVMSALGIPIISEEQAREEHPDYMLVGPWFFRSSLIDREKLYLAKGGSLIFPLPRVDVVSYA